MTTMVTIDTAGILEARILTLKYDLLICTRNPRTNRRHGHTRRARMTCPDCARTLLTLNNLYAQQNREETEHAAFTT